MLAKHAQHVVLIHFTIALFIVAVGFDYNLVVAAIFTVPTMLSGLAAWQWRLQGHRLKGILLYHLAFGVASAMVILVSWWMHFRERSMGRLPGGGVANTAGIGGSAAADRHWASWRIPK